MVKNPPANAGDVSSGISLGVGNGNPLKYSCLGNLMDRGTWQATVHRLAKRQTEHAKVLYLVHRLYVQVPCSASHEQLFSHLVHLS